MFFCLQVHLDVESSSQNNPLYGGKASQFLERVPRNRFKPSESDKKMFYQGCTSNLFLDPMKVVFKVPSNNNLSYTNVCKRYCDRHADEQYVILMDMPSSDGTIDKLACGCASSETVRHFVPSFLCSKKCGEETCGGSFGFLSVYKSSSSSVKYFCYILNFLMTWLVLL